MLFIFSLLLLCGNGLTASLDDYKDWKPDSQVGFTYCESVIGSGVTAGIACGGTSFKKMQKKQASLRVQTTMGSTLALLNIAWISRAAWSTQRDFYQTCKPYLIRLYDGLYNNYNQMRCVTAFPTPDGIDPTCNDSSNTILKSGSGYCMSEAVCGASNPIYFIATNETGATYIWGPGITGFQTSGSVVGKCYGYGSINQSSPLENTILNNMN